MSRPSYRLSSYTLATTPPESSTTSGSGTSSMLRETTYCFNCAYGLVKPCGSPTA